MYGVNNINWILEAEVKVEMADLDPNSIKEYFHAIWTCQEIMISIRHSTLEIAENIKYE